MPGTLINLGGLTKPATVLIERVSDAVGGFARPWQITRVAKAESKAAIIRAQAQIEITELEERAFRRLAFEEGKKQDNIETITLGAVPYLNEDAQPETIPEDWITHFFEKCRLTSDTDMQLLWSKILAGNANTPGSFSRKTIDLVSTIEKIDAEILTSVYDTVLFCRDYKALDDVDADFTDAVPLILKMEDYRGGNELCYNNLAHLENLGFIQFDGLSEYEISNSPRFVDFKLRDRFITVDTNGSPITIGKVILTKPGQELFRVVGGGCSEENLLLAIRYWMIRGHSVFSKLQ